jgi:site-specific DNA-cytosine methylase
MRLLELFCGSKSVGKVAETLGYQVISVDMNAEWKPTIVADMLTWDYKVFPPGHFDVVWASPPCEHYSCLNHTHPEKNALRPQNLALADSLVRKAIEIIEWFNPEKFFIENPQSGELKDREMLQGIPFIDLDYCQFSDWGYRKRTRIWTTEDKASVICKPSECPNIAQGTRRHKKALGNAEYKEFRAPGVKRILSRYAIPPNLILYLLQ